MHVKKGAARLIRWPHFDSVVLLFSFTVMVSAALLFIVQPMFSKMVLPLLGGAPAVWNTALMFFQGMLLLGYGYAHLLTRLFSWKYQIGIHIALMSIAFLALPIAPMAGWRPPSSELPVLWLVGLFTFSIGLPFFVISANAPLLQHWFSVSGHRHASDPYFLYAASNFGSIAALLVYPILVEPVLGLNKQSVAWSGAYVLLIALIALSTLFAGSNARQAKTTAPLETDQAARVEIGWRPQLQWTILAFVPSSLLLGVTAHITTDVAAAPFIWVLPLVLYLLSFVLVFGRWSPIKSSWMVKIQPYLIVTVAITLWGGGRLWIYFMILHLATFFVCAMVCHAELARLRPAPVHLTRYYFFLSLGGLLGGVFNALVAPAVFDRIYEYPIALALACLLRPTLKNTTKSTPWLDITLPALLFIAAVAPFISLDNDPSEHGLSFILPYLLVIGSLLFSFRLRPGRFSLGVAATFIAFSITLVPQNILIRERSFFGLHFVQSASARGLNILWNGTTEHGAQFTDTEKRREPLSYYHRDGPFGEIFATFADATFPARIGLIGLGTGALACYRKENQSWTFFEIDPAVVRIASSSGYFHYLSDCAPGERILIGDGRLSLANIPDDYFGILIVDAFSSDAIPIHLATREAISLYLSKLQENGILVFHISNRHLNLEPVLSGIAHDLGVFAYANSFAPLSPQQQAEGKRVAHVMVLSRSESRLSPLRNAYRWRRSSATEGSPVWTDDYSDLLRALRY